MDNNSGMKPVAARVAENVRALRKERGLDLAEVAERMAHLGRPLSLNGVSKVERGKRGVDVDDLVALALALDVTPNRLLLTPGAGKQPVVLAPDRPVSERAAWEWATGEQPLQPAGTPSDHLVVPDRDRFEVENRPYAERDDWTMERTMAHEDVLAPVALAARTAVKAGVPMPTVQSYLSMTQSAWRLTDAMWEKSPMSKIDWSNKIDWSKVVGNGER